MKFRTEIEIPDPPFSIDHSMRGLSLGSCFAGNIADKLARAKFSVCDNPFGVLFNPASISQAIEDVAAGRAPRDEELRLHNGLWSHFSFHGRFSHTDKYAALAGMQQAFFSAVGALRSCDYVIITWGTAWIYELPGGRIAANCHKFPASEFRRRKLTVAGIAQDYEKLFHGPLAGKKVILTVSPVRHLKDGFAGNSFSKAALLLAAEELSEKYADCFYFPAFEILNDDLRDYRFYGRDLVHPSPEAVDYVWENFSCRFFTNGTTRACAEAEAIALARGHRFTGPPTPQSQAFASASLRRIGEAEKCFPGLDFSTERAHFENMLKI